MLVLLIVFMVAAPLATTSIKATMPPPGPVVARQVPAVFVSLQKDGTIHVGSQRLGERAGDWRSLASLLRDMSDGNFGAQVFVRADREVSYGDFVRLFDEVRAAGYAKVSVMTEDPGA